VATILSSVLGMVLSMALSLYMGWLLGLIIFGAFPVVIGISSLMYAVFNTGTVETMKAYAQSAGYAEQALQSIKVVHTYS
jgi:ABC-type multidrug transport system fused ATPase/permease subunit